MANKEGTWLPILDYSLFKKVSISTIRRHIKANLLRWREENGKYYVWTPVSSQDIETRKEGDLLALRLEVQELSNINRALQEELDETRMLVRLYEQGMGLPPEVPLA